MESDDFDHNGDFQNGHDRVEKPYAQAKLLSATEKCPVCGDQAAKHVHYGAMTCFSCRAFFRRSIQNKTADNYVCRRTESCDITLKTRKNCQYCRFQKCMSVGMKRSNVLSEEERNHRFRKTRDKKVSESSEMNTDNTSQSTISLTDQLQGVSLNRHHTSPTSFLAVKQESALMQQHNGGLMNGAQLQPPVVTSSGGSSSSTAGGLAAALAVNGKVDVANGNSQVKSVLLGSTSRGRSVIVGRGGLPPDLTVSADFRQNQQQQLLAADSGGGGGFGSLHNNQSALKIKEEPILLSPQNRFSRDCHDLSSISPEDALGVIEKVPLDDFSVLLDANGLDQALQMQESSSGDSNLTCDRYSDSRSPHEPFPEFGASLGVYQNESAAPTPATIDSSATSTTDFDEFEEDFNYSSTYPGYNACTFDSLTKFETEYIEMLVREHHQRYISINFGEELIKEMIMCSMFNISISANAAITGYQLCVQRMTKIAESLEPFQMLSLNDRKALLQENSDLLVSLRAAIFFDASKKGIDQVLVSMGVEDMEKIKTMFSRLMEDNSSMKHIQYEKFNSLQNVESKNERELKYSVAIAKVARLLSNDTIIVLMTLIILFSGDFCILEDRMSVEKTQGEFVLLLRKYFNTHSTSRAQGLVKFASTLDAISLIREMTEIKKSRKVSDKVRLPISS